MDNLDIFLIIISAVIAFQVTKEIFTIRKRPSGINEARRFFERMSETESEIDYSKEQKIGLALAKKKGEEKYSLIPQSKLVGLELA